LTRRRVVDDDERVMWAFDPWDSAAAEVAAALHIGHRRASGQMRIAQALRDRLPQVAALYWKGAISGRVVSAITWGTHLVEDEHALALIDTAITDRATRWGPLSEDKLRQAVDTQVNQHDPDAVRRAQTSLRGRDFTIGACDDDTDTTAVWGRLRATDAAVLNKRITAMTGRCVRTIRAAPVNADPTLRDRGPTATTTWRARVDRRPVGHRVNDPPPTWSSGSSPTNTPSTPPPPPPRNPAQR
jgi:hypothetical protein